MTPITITDAQRAERDQLMQQFIADMRRRANDDSDPETRDNARTLLRLKGISW